MFTWFIFCKMAIWLLYFNLIFTCDLWQLTKLQGYFNFRGFSKFKNLAFGISFSTKLNVEILLQSTHHLELKGVPKRGQKVILIDNTDL